MLPPTKKRKFITLEDKAAIISEVEKGRKKIVIAEEFGVACSSLSTIFKKKASILGALESGACARNKTAMAAAFPDVDKAVFACFCEQRANKVPLSRKILQQKALDFACMLSHDNFKASPGWLSRFKARHDIVAKVISGEAAAASCTNPVEPEEGSPVGAFDDCTGNSAVPPSLTSVWGELCAVANEISNGLSVHEFVCADEGIVVHE
ncbi:hypothetical protein HPB51_025301 [Rhipicephalus microplus]|uniref:HTH CENPB-type domain-containing protein n=1 Tax=Rhipicephalus microplus TaxID=6941 RepID=A0A9J6FA02_RHIMP|nr:hypothetical protein HPB51_025301 [Rhipicephalus microplus]